ncbi:unnamed protein product [Lactuca virosa]|uniref:Uncharacterized protein n=1 Tax=Lactuca virosa TaxID=75947 RepID=A0AAU9NIJ7_9ASTR|nr:unnamed protein product [Lactuca virosa]
MDTFGHWSSTRVLLLEFSTVPPLNCLFKQRGTNWSSLRCLIFPTSLSPCFFRPDPPTPPSLHVSLPISPVVLINDQSPISGEYRVSIKRRLLHWSPPLQHRFTYRPVMIIHHT